MIISASLKDACWMFVRSSSSLEKAGCKSDVNERPNVELRKLESGVDHTTWSVVFRGKWTKVVISQSSDVFMEAGLEREEVMVVPGVHGWSLTNYLKREARHFETKWKLLLLSRL